MAPIPPDHTPDRQCSAALFLLVLLATATTPTRAVNPSLQEMTILDQQPKHVTAGDLHMNPPILDIPSQLPSEYNTEGPWPIADDADEFLAEFSLERAQQVQASAPLPEYAGKWPVNDAKIMAAINQQAFASDSASAASAAATATPYQRIASIASTILAQLGSTSNSVSPAAAADLEVVVDTSEAASNVQLLIDPAAATTPIVQVTVDPLTSSTPSNLVGKPLAAAAAPAAVLPSSAGSSSKSSNIGSSVTIDIDVSVSAEQPAGRDVVVDVSVISDGPWPAPGDAEKRIVPELLDSVNVHRWTSPSWFRQL